MRVTWTLGILCLLFTNHVQKDSVVSAKLQQSLGMRRSQNSRTRFQQRINRLGKRKLELIRSGRLGKSKGLPPGFALIDDQVVDSSNKVIQKETQAGTVYYSFGDTQGRQPLFMRPGNERGWRYVIFQDPFYWRGSGHLILLKKVLGVVLAKSKAQLGTLYEAYTLSLRASLHPRVHIKDPAFRKKLLKRRRKYGTVMSMRQTDRKGLHLRNRAGKLGKRRKRDAVTFRMNRLLHPEDCLLTTLTFILLY